MGESFPRQQARTRRFTLGVPRSFRVDVDQTQVLFLRSLTGDDPFTCLWRLDLHTAEETLLVGPDTLDLDETDLSAAERARRERARESAGGVVGFDASDDGGTVVFSLGGALVLLDVESGRPQVLDTPPGVFDPRLGADGSVAYACGGHLRVWSNGDDRVLLRGDGEITWAVPEFVAAEEMGRARGFWWSPDATGLLVARVDPTPSPECAIASPVDPTRAATTVRYPFAGAANAVVELHYVTRSGESIRVDWDAGGGEYLVDVRWPTGDEPWCLVQTRDQKTMTLRTIDIASGSTEPRAIWTDAHWVEPVPGSPVVDGDRVFSVGDVDAQRSLLIDGDPVTPPDLYVRRLLSAADGRCVVEASPDPTTTGIYEVVEGELSTLVEPTGVASGTVQNEVLVVSSSTPEASPATWVQRTDMPPLPIERVAQTPVIEPNVELLVVGERSLRTAVLRPRDHEGKKLPVLLDPYGGPHAQRVTRHPGQFLTSQWFADQGFIVIVTDGRGTPGRDPAFERAVAGDLAAPVLDDQIAALEAVAEQEPSIDLDRVAIRGWSFGGYLAALAVLRRPDIFRCAVAGAPVTDWRLYDTHYTERYLGHPDTDSQPYEATSLIAEASALSRPLLLIHGLADDNVLAAHTLQLSRALLEAGRPHEVLPLSDVTHMTPQEEVAENLLLLQLDFLRRHCV